MKCSNSVRNAVFNAQGSRAIIVAVKVGAVKIYAVAMDALRKKERQGETQETINFQSFTPC
jgi:type IV secretory pathway VirB10-like protein